MESNSNPTSINEYPRQRPLVAVVRSDNRRGAVAEALALIAKDLPLVIRPKALVLPTIGPRTSSSTTAEVLSAVIDVLLQQDQEGGALTVASAVPRAVAGFRRLRYQQECWDRPVHFLNLERDSTIIVQGEDRPARTWPSFRSARKLQGETSRPTALRLCRTVIASDCRVAIVPCKAISGSLQRFLQAAIPPIGQGQTSYNRNLDLQRLLRLCLPQLSIVEGPSGWSNRRVLAIAGTDPIAVEAVAVATLGLQVQRSTEFEEAEAAGLGVADLSRIELTGDPISTTRQRQRRILRFGDGRRVDRGRIGNSPTKATSGAEDQEKARSGGAP